MQNLFHADDSQQIISRLRQLPESASALWGKMNVSQMLAHCQAPLEVALGERQLKQTLVGFLFGRLAKKKLLKDAVFQRNLPTDPNFVVKADKKFDIEMQRLLHLVKSFSSTDPGLIAERRHPFFGMMSIEEWGVLSWKHLDHHLRQFGA